MRCIFCLLLLPCLVAAADSALAPLRWYEGTWQVKRSDAPAGAQPETLINQCAMLGNFYACSQNVNGAQQGLVVFMPGNAPGRFYTQSIMPDGRATGRVDLQIDGSVWTYSSRRDEGGKTTYYRTLNTFSGRTRIHFETSQSTNNKDWTVNSSGDEVKR